MDTQPNALDLAIYTTSQSRILRGVIYFVYPLYLTVALYESLWLEWWLWQNPAPARWFFLVVWMLIWSRATWLIVTVWWERVGVLRSRAKASVAARAG